MSGRVEFRFGILESRAELPFEIGRIKLQMLGGKSAGATNHSCSTPYKLYQISACELCRRTQCACLILSEQPRKGLCMVNLPLATVRTMSQLSALFYLQTVFMFCLVLAQSVAQLTTGFESSCVVFNRSNVKCFGKNTAGQLGIESSHPNIGDEPGEMGKNLSVVDTGGNGSFVIREISPGSGANHRCILFERGDMKCFGSNVNGKLGYEDNDDRGDEQGELGDSLPFVNVSSVWKVRSVAVGRDHTCALLENRLVKCFGSSQYGQLGYGDPSARGDSQGQMGDNLPFVDLGSNVVVKAIVVGGFHSCVLFEDERMKCFGNNDFGQLGYGDTNNRGDEPNEMGDNLTFVDVGTNYGVKQITAGVFHTCVLLSNNQVKCFGKADLGEIGSSNSSSIGIAPDQIGDSLPFVDLGSGLGVRIIASGEFHNCVVFTSNQVKCFGFNSKGQLGLNDTNPRGNLPGQMGDSLPVVQLGAGLTVHEMALGDGQTCVLFTNGRVKCFGHNNHGQLGYGDTENRGDDVDEMGDFLKFVDLDGIVDIPVTDTDSIPIPTDVLPTALAVIAAICCALAVLSLAVLLFKRRRRQYGKNEISVESSHLSEEAGFGGARVGVKNTVVKSNSFADQKQRKGRFVADYRKTAVGKLLATHGFVQYAKQFYNEGVYNVEALSQEDLEDIGVKDRKDREAIVALFNNEGSTVSRKRRSSRQKKDQTGLKYDCFLTHNWLEDELGRSNHDTVSKVNAALKGKGLNTWFDEERMEGFIKQQMARGIDQSHVVVVFVTSTYMAKVDSTRGDDNCKLEFEYAHNRKSNYLIGVPMEPGTLNTKTWFGPVGLALGGKLYEANFAFDVETDKAKFEEQVQNLYEQILRLKKR